MENHGITHQFGPWSPMRFIPIPFRDADQPPAFWVTTSRACRGIHDIRCTHAESQTFGPLALEGSTAADVIVCPNCSRQQPPTDPAVETERPVCLFCSDSSTVQYTALPGVTRAAVTAVAALDAASTTLRQTKEVNPAHYVALLDETGDMLRSLMEDAAWVVKQDPERITHAGYANIVLIARQVVANAREYARLSNQQLPVRKNEE